MVERSERIAYLAIGASDAAGVGANPITRSYVFRIADELDARVDEVFLAPLALPGATAGQIDRALELFLESGIESNLVTVWTGPNDVIPGEDVDDFEDELEDIFAEVPPCGQRLGAVSAEAAATGLTTDCVVAVARHDRVMGALATGSLAPGVLLDSMGSAEGLTLALEASTTEPEIGRRGYSQGVVEVERPIPYVFGGFPTSGACVEWFRGLFGTGGAAPKGIRARPPGRAARDRRGPWRPAAP